MDLSEHPADSICGVNHDPKLREFARKCYNAGSRDGLSGLKAIIDGLRPNLATDIAWGEGQYGEMVAYDTVIKEIDRLMGETKE